MRGYHLQIPTDFEPARDRASAPAASHSGRRPYDRLPRAYEANGVSNEIVIAAIWLALYLEILVVSLTASTT